MRFRFALAVLAALVCSSDVQGKGLNSTVIAAQTVLEERLGLVHTPPPHSSVFVKKLSKRWNGGYDSTKKSIQFRDTFRHCSLKWMYKALQARELTSSSKCDEFLAVMTHELGHHLSLRLVRHLAGHVRWGDRLLYGESHEDLGANVVAEGIATYVEYVMVAHAFWGPVPPLRKFRRVILARRTKQIDRYTYEGGLALVYPILSPDFKRGLSCLVKHRFSVPFHRGTYDFRGVSVYQRKVLACVHS